MSRHARRAASGRLRLGAIVCLFLVSLLTPVAALAAGPATIREELNLRSGPGLGYGVLVVMPAGSAVAITGADSEGWYPVRYQEIAGWAYAEYIAIDGAANSEATAAGGNARGAATVVTSLLNMRGGPGLSYGVIAQLPYGTTVQIVGDPKAGDGRTWLEVAARGRGQGWVAAEYLDAGEMPGSAAQATPPPAPTPAPTPAPPPSAPANTGGTMVEIITAAANRYGQSPSAMLAVARCESNLNPNAVNRSSGASGLFQFLPGTFRSTPYASYPILDPWANANAAGWMWSVGRRGEWVC